MILSPLVLITLDASVRGTVVVVCVCVCVSVCYHASCYIPGLYNASSKQGAIRLFTAFQGVDFVENTVQKFWRHLPTTMTCHVIFGPLKTNPAIQTLETNPANQNPAHDPAHTYTTVHAPRVNYTVQYCLALQICNMQTSYS